MTGAGRNNGMFTNKMSLGGGDIEAGSSNGHVSYIQRKSTPIEAPLEKMEDGGNNEGEVVEIDKWVDSLARILEDVPRYMCSRGHPGRISRIPENLREVDVKAYEPYFLSIGPYHHGKPRVQHMEKRKQRILKGVLKNRPELTLKDYLKEIKSIEPAVINFYSDVEMENGEFVHMLLLDSLYILAVFCGMVESPKRLNKTNTRTRNTMDNVDANESVMQINEVMEMGGDSKNTQMMARAEKSNDEMMSGDSNEDQPGWFWTLFLHDVFLLENQLPFFVLQKMHMLAYGGPETQLIDIMRVKVGIMLSNYTKVDSAMIPPIEVVHHLLHLCHLFFRPTQHEPISCQISESSQMFRLGSAVQLYETGVSFEVRSGSTRHSLLDLTFGNSGKLAMPYLVVDDITDPLLRNLIALKQMKYPTLGLDVSAYAVLLLHLITTPEDVELLRRKGIIQYHLATDKEMMHLVNRLSVGLSFDYVEDKYSLKPVFQELKRYTVRRVPQWRAWLKHRYFSNPWTAISLLAASLLLFLSVLQTYYAVYSYYHPCFDGPS